MVLLKYHTSYEYEHASCHTMNMVAFEISHLQIPDFLKYHTYCLLTFKYHTYAKTNPPLSLKHRLDNTLQDWKNCPNTVTECFLPSVDLTHDCIYPPIGVN
jgi:hypothetical protein